MARQWDEQKATDIWSILTANKTVSISVIRDKNTLDSEPRFNEISNKSNISDLLLHTQV